MSVSTPTLSPTTGTYSTIQTVTISVAKPIDATIRYTTDGSDPTPSHGTVYSTPISVAKTTTVKAVAYRSGWLNSKTASETYTMNLTTRTLWVPDLVTNQYYQDPATLVFTGSHCLVYVENSTASSVPLTTAQNIADKFDNVIYGLDHTYFGTESDLDGNGKVILFILDIKDGYSSSTGGGYVAGFFNPGDMYTTQSNSYSNHGEILYLDDNPASPSTDPGFYPTMAHEFQHMINYNEREILHSYSPEDTWINEGLSTAAEGLYDAQEQPYGVPYDKNRVDYYNTSPYNNKIAAGQNFISWGARGDLVASYVTDYLFFEWMKQQVARTTATDGTQIFKQIIDSSGYDYTVVQNVFSSEMGADVPGSWGITLLDWFVANLLNKGNSLYGYYNDTTLFTLTPPTVPSTASGSTYTLYPGEGIYVNSSSWNPSPSAPISYVGVNTTNGTVYTSSPYTGSNTIIAYNSDGTATDINQGQTPTGGTTATLPDILPAPNVVTKTMAPAKPMPIDVIFGADGKPRTAGLGAR